MATRKKNRKLMIQVFGGSALLLIASVLGSRHLFRPKAPAPPSAQEELPRVPAAPPRCGPLHYATMVRRDAAAYQVAAPSIEELQQPLRGGRELDGARTLKARGGALETAHLRLQVQVVKLGASLDGTQGFRADHLVLAITNKSAVPIAYRVATAPPRGGRCGSKADLPHNAIALRPRETVRRTECLFHDGDSLVVTRVDAYELTELGHRYVSRLGPTAGSPFDLRVARAHDRGALAPCRTMPWRDLEGQEDPFRAVVDFHARHSCDEYSLPLGYRPFTTTGELPVCGR